MAISFHPYRVVTRTASTSTTINSSVVVPTAAFGPGGACEVVSSGANATFHLPASSLVPIGAECKIICRATGAEMRAYPESSDFINGVNASTTKELAVAANETHLVFKRADKNWVALGITSAGAMGSTEATTGVPD